MKTNTQNKKKSQRARREYNTLPVKVSRKEFNRYIKPQLSVPTKGPKTRLSTYQIFNCILYVLHTGMQWYNLTPPRGVSWQAVYHHHLRWSRDGSYQRIFTASLAWLNENGKLDLTALHGDGSNTVAKKGAAKSDIPATSTSAVKKSST